MKKILSIILVLCLLVGIIPLTAAADQETLGESLRDGLSIAEYFPDPTIASFVADAVKPPRSVNDPVSFDELKGITSFGLWNSGFNNIEGFRLLPNIATFSLMECPLPISFQPEEELSGLSKLFRVTIDTCPNLEKLPASLMSLPKLRQLEFYRTGISEIPHEIGNLQSLEALMTYENQITTIPEEISNLKKLRVLNVIENLEEFPDFIGRITQLEELYLGYPGLTTASSVPLSFRNLTSLRHLALFGQLKEVPFYLDEFTALKSLNLSRSSLIEEIDPAIFELDELYLSGQTAILDDFHVTSAEDITWDKLAPPFLQQLKREGTTYPHHLNGKWEVTILNPVLDTKYIDCGDGSEIHPSLFPYDGEYEVIYQSSGDYDLNGHKVNNLEYKINIFLDSSGSEEWPAWSQPFGAHDAYPAGAKVSHNGKNWINIHGDGNVWEPGVYGWQEQQ